MGGIWNLGCAAWNLCNLCRHPGSSGLRELALAIGGRSRDLVASSPLLEFAIGKRGRINGSFAPAKLGPNAVPMSVLIVSDQVLFVAALRLRPSLRYSSYPR